MTGKIVLQYSNNNSVNSSTNSTDHLPSYTPTEVATAVSFMAGVFQVNIKIGLFYFKYSSYVSIQIVLNNY